MKRLFLLIIAFILIAGPVSVFAQRSRSSSRSSSGGTVSVKGHTRRDGTYVEPHKRTAPNSTKRDNYSTKGNTNPYTGKKGTKKVY
jgi:hypothetical protein